MRSTLKATFAVFTTILMTAVSCNKEIAETQNPLLEKHTCEMKLVGSLVNFDGPDTRADANTTTWADGSIIYLRMNSPLGATTGEAIYNASKDVWTISYYGSLYEGVSNSCIALYLEDKVAYDNNIFTYDEGTAIYEDLDGSYIYDGGDLIVTANLSPKTGRIRFKGTPGSVLKVYGITHYTTYDISTDNYTTSAAPFKLTVGEDGYTPYLYGYFTDTDEPNVKLWIDAKEAYTRFCSKDIFKPGQSGKMTIPSAISHNGWTDGLHFIINGAKFKMIAVEGDTFILGNPSSNDEYYTAHNVTLTGFCIGETEVTYKTFNRLTNPTYTNVKNQQPYTESLAQTTAIAFANDLTDALEVPFSLPTEAQWTFAAQGGTKAQGFTYSGSDDIDEVAWYDNNSDNVLHDVKGKLPNELGLYDMTGNANEYVLDIRAPFSEKAQTDPCVEYTGTNNNAVIKGGNYKSSNTHCTNIYRGSTARNTCYSGANNPGFRLALNWN